MLMKCGHAPNGTCLHTGDKICVICIGIDSGYNQVAEDMKFNDMAKCMYCKTVRPSSDQLPFFSHNKEKQLDSFYCGCLGWD